MWESSASQAAFQKQDGVVKCLGAAIHDVHHGAGAIFVGLHRGSFPALDRRHLAVPEMQLHPLAQLLHDLVLEVEDVANRAVNLDRTDHGT